jgi:hypothetical protein
MSNRRRKKGKRQHKEQIRNEEVLFKRTLHTNHAKGHQIDHPPQVPITSFGYLAVSLEFA